MNTMTVFPLFIVAFLSITSIVCCVMAIRDYLFYRRMDCRAILPFMWINLGIMAFLLFFLILILSTGGII